MVIMVKVDEYTTIRIRRRAREELGELRKGEETLADVVDRLIDAHAER